MRAARSSAARDRRTPSTVTSVCDTNQRRSRRRSLTDADLLTDSVSLIGQSAVLRPHFADHIGGAARKSAPALDSNIIGGINASGFLFASHAFEISRIGGIRLLRAQSASCIAHCIVPVVCAAHIASVAQAGIDPGRQSVDLGRRPTWIDAKAGRRRSNHRALGRPEQPGQGAPLAAPSTETPPPNCNSKRFRIAVRPIVL